MNLTNYLPLIIVGFLQLMVIGLFFYRLKYVKLCKLTLWGVFLIVSPLFTGLAVTVCYFLFPHILYESATFFMSNIMLLFEMGIILLIYQKHKKIDVNILKAIFIIFFVLWIAEFITNKGSNITVLSTTTVFQKVVVVILVWLYLFDLYTTSHKQYSKIPFFWIAVGWLLYYATTSAIYTPGIESQEETTSKYIVYYIQTGVAVVASLLYAIGFWKTKAWVLKNQ